MGPIPAAQAPFVLESVGLLARGALHKCHAGRFAALREGNPSARLPRLALTQALEPLFLHHAEQLGLEPGDVLDLVAPCLLPAPSSPTELALAYFQRRALLQELFAELARVGVGRVMAVKGAALAERYPSPALRAMGDADLVVSADDSRAACAAFASLGWHGRGGIWSHPSGAMVDLLTPETPFARCLWNSAVPAPESWRSPGLVFPTDEAHLLLLAFQATKNGGSRIWRDLCDANVLLDNGTRAEVARDAIGLAAALELSVPLAAFLAFLNEVAHPVQPVPVPDLAAGEGATRDRFLAVYRELAVDRLSVVALDSLGTVVLPWRELLSRAARAVRGGIAGRPEEGWESPRERDPLLGDLPETGSWQRQRIKLELAWQALRSGHWSRYRRLSAARREMTAIGRTFTPLA
jgi:hypothetical protein